MVSLQTGMIQAIPTTPYAAVAMQWYRHTPYMMELGVAPLMGGTIVSERSWKKLSADEQQVLQEAADHVATKLAAEVPELDANAVKEMESRGVTVVAPRSEEERAEWETAARSFAESMKKATVPPEAYEMAVMFRDEFRNSQ
jgi:TRAP-type C4-dicarboxylate transport system substrate-binding protein